MLLGGPRPALLELLQLGLEHRPGLKVLARCTSVEETVQAVALHGPDLVLTSAETSGWDGVGACAEIKRLGRGTRVMVIGAPGDQATLLASVRAGADGFITAEDTLDDLVGAIRKVSRGESHVPPLMLGALLRGLIEFRREDDAALERFASLGKREREVLAEVVNGLDYHAIASKLHLSPHTARGHMQNILSKLGVHSRLEATRLVLEHDLFGRFGSQAEEGVAVQRGAR